MTPWDQQLARVLVRPLARTSISPNHLTAFTLALALFAASLFTLGDRVAMNWGAGLFVLARFMDHFDGELARLKGKASRFGYYFDYVAGALSYAAFFVCVGVGLSRDPLGVWGPALGVAGGLAALISMPLNVGIDNATKGDQAVGYPAFAGFELEDGIYLIAPITWLGLLPAFFVLAGVGATAYCLWTLWSLLRARRRRSVR